MAQVLLRRTNYGTAGRAGYRRLLEGAFDWLIHLLGLRAQRGATPMTTAPLSPMITALQALLEQQRALDQPEAQEAVDRARSPEPREMNLEAIDHLERAIACVAGSDARDAVVQVVIAAGRAQALEQDTFERPSAEELAVVLKLLRSALPALAQQTWVDLEAFGADYYGLRGQATRSTRQPPAADAERSQPDGSAEDAPGDGRDPAP